MKPHKKIMDKKLGSKLNKVTQKSKSEMKKSKNKARVAIKHKYPTK